MDPAHPPHPAPIGTELSRYKPEFGVFFGQPFPPYMLFGTL
jgi:hypothetical protein